MSFNSLSALFFFRFPPKSELGSVLFYIFFSSFPDELVLLVSNLNNFSPAYFPHTSSIFSPPGRNAAMCSFASFFSCAACWDGQRDYFDLCFRPPDDECSSVLRRRSSCYTQGANRASDPTQCTLLPTAGGQGTNNVEVL